MNLRARSVIVPVLAAMAAGIAGFLAGQASSHRPDDSSSGPGGSLVSVPSHRPAQVKAPVTLSATDSIPSVIAWYAALEKSLPDVSPEDRAAALRLLLRNWNPSLPAAEAWTAAASMPPGPLRDALLERIWPGLAAADPSAAWKASFLLTPEASADARTRLVLDWQSAGKPPAELAAILDSAPESERLGAAAAAISSLATLSPESAITAADALEDESLRSAAHLTIANDWAQSNPAAAADWSLTKNIPGAMAAVMQHWAASDASAASRWLAAQPAGPERDSAAAALVEGLVVSDPEAARAWAGDIADKSARAGLLARLDLAAQASR